MSANTGTLDNILQAGGSTLTIGGITGPAASYNVYDDLGTIVATGLWPSVVEPTLSDNASGSTTLSVSPTTATLTLTLSANPVVGDTIVVALGGTPDPVMPGTITGAPSGLGNIGVSSWTFFRNTGNNPGFFYVGTVTSTPTGKSVAYTTDTTGSSGLLNGTIMRWAGVAPFALIDDEEWLTTSAASPVFVPVPTTTPLGKGDLIIATVQGFGTITGPESGSSFTELSSVGSTQHSNGFGCAYYLNSGSSPVSGGTTNGWNCTAGFGGWCAAALALAPAVGGSSIAIPAPSASPYSGAWLPGVYTVVFYNSSSTIIDIVGVSMIRSVSGVGLPVASQLPAYGTTTTPGGIDPAGTNGDLYMHGMSGAGPERYQISSGTAPTNASPSGFNTGFGGSIANIETALTIESGTNGTYPSSWYFDPAYQDPARPRYPLVAFPNDIVSSGSSNEAAYQSGVALVATDLGPGTTSNVTYFEGLNEPSTAGQSQAQSAAQYGIFRAALHSGNSAAKAIGPGEVSQAPAGASGSFIPYVSGTNSIATWISTVGAGNIDGFSLHLYNGWNGDFVVTDGWLSAFMAVLASNGLTNSSGLSSLPVWITEAGNIYYNFPNNLCLYDPQRIVQWLMQFYLTLERWGIPIEQVFLYEDGNHGNISSSSWIKETDASLRAHFVAQRVYREELWGKTHSRSLTFGATGDKLYRGDVFAPSGGSGAGVMVALTAQGMAYDTVVLAGCGSGSITYSDWRGRTSTVTAINGQITVPVSATPTYVRLAASCSATVSVLECGSRLPTSPNLAATATATSTNGSSPSLVNDGSYQTDGYLASPDTPFVGASLPVTVTETWSTAQTIGSVVIRQVAPWTNNPGSGAAQCAMLTGTLQYYNGSAWVNCPTVAQGHWDSNGNYSNPTAGSAYNFAAPFGHNTSQGPGTGAPANVLSFYDNNWVHSVLLSTAISTTAIRLVISTASYGHIGNATIAGTYFTGGATITPSGIVSEMMAFAPVGGIITGPNATADPNANTAAVAQLYALWAAANTGKHYSGAHLSGFDLFNNPPGLAPEWDQYQLTTGYFPAIMSFDDAYPVFGSAYNPTTTDIWGLNNPAWSMIEPAAEWASSYGGLVQMLIQDISNPTLYTYSTGTAPQSATTIGAINTATTITLQSFNYTSSSISGDVVTMSTTPSNVSAGQIVTGPGLTGLWTVSSRSGSNVTIAPGSGGSGAPTSGTFYFVNPNGFSASGGNGVLVVGTGTSQTLTTFSYTSMTGSGASTTLNGVVVAIPSGDSGSTTVSAGAMCCAAQLSSQLTTLVTPSQALPLQYSSTAYSTIGVGTSSSYKNANVVNANGNLNRGLDNIIRLCTTLNSYGITVSLRLFAEESDSGVWWFNGLSWFPQLWQYCVAYLTGNASLGFSGQPVVGSNGSGLTAPHNILFCYCEGGNPTSNKLQGSPTPPASNLVDLLAADAYNANTTYWANYCSLLQCATNGPSGASNYTNIPVGLGEFYGNTNASDTGSGPAARAFAPGTPVPVATTVAAINAAGSINFESIGCTNNGNFSSGGGSGWLLCSDGWHTFTYTGTFIAIALTGVVVSTNPVSGPTTTGGSTVAAGAMCTSQNPLLDVSTLTSGSTFVGIYPITFGQDDTAFPSSGNVAVPTANGIQIISCSSISPTTFGVGTVVTFTVASVVTTVSFAACTGSQATLTLGSVTQTGAQIGDTITVAGFTGAFAGLNGTHTVTGTTSNTVTFASTVAAGSTTPSGAYVTPPSGSYIIPTGMVTGIDSNCASNASVLSAVKTSLTQTQSITGISLNGSTATVTVASTQALTTGTQATIAGYTGSYTGLNGSQTITVISSTQFTFASSLTGTATSSSPTATTPNPLPGIAYFNFWDGGVGLSMLYQGGMQSVLGDPSVINLSTPTSGGGSITLSGGSIGSVKGSDVASISLSSAARGSPTGQDAATISLLGQAIDSVAVTAAASVALAGAAIETASGSATGSVSVVATAIGSVLGSDGGSVQLAGANLSSNIGSGGGANLSLSGFAGEGGTGMSNVVLSAQAGVTVQGTASATVQLAGADAGTPTGSAHAAVALVGSSLGGPVVSATASITLTGYLVVPALNKAFLTLSGSVSGTPMTGPNPGSVTASDTLAFTVTASDTIG